MPDMMRAALDYVAAGWPVSPAWPPVPSGRRVRLRDRFGSGREPTRCSCPAADACPTPAAHQAGGPTLDPAEVRRVWSERCWNIALHTGTAVDVIEASTALGAQAMRILERGRPPYPAIARTSAGRWLFVVAPSGREPELPDRAAWHGPGSWVLAPPSRRGTVPDRWVWVPRPHRLASAARVVEALHAVRLHPWEMGADDRPTAPFGTGQPV